MFGRPAMAMVRAPRGAVQQLQLDNRKSYPKVLFRGCEKRFRNPYHLKYKEPQQAMSWLLTSLTCSMVANAWGKMRDAQGAEK